MMRHLAAVAGVALFLCALPGSADEPPDANVQGIRVGRAAADAYVEWLSPRICSVVLERNACRLNLLRLQASSNPSQTAAFDRWLQSSDTRQRPHAFDPYFPPATLWRTDPTFAWWSCAADLVELDGVSDPTIAAYRTELAGFLSANDAAAPAGLGGLFEPGVSHRKRFTAIFTAMQSIVPIEPVPAIDKPDATVDPMRTGVYTGTLNELLDSPAVIELPETRAFAQRVIDWDETLDRSFHDRFSFDELRARLRGPIPAKNSDAMMLDFKGPIQQWQTALHTDRVKADSFLFGITAPGVAANAVSERNIDIDNYRIFLLGIKAIVKAPTPEARDAVMRLLDVSIDDRPWSAVNVAATNAVRAIVGSPSPSQPTPNGQLATPAPPAPDVSTSPSATPHPP